MSSLLAIKLAERLIDELDPVSAFLECMTEEREEGRTRSIKLYQMYTMWCTVWGIEPMTHHDLNADLIAKGYRRVRPGNRIYWCGMVFSQPNYYVHRIEEGDE